MNDAIVGGGGGSGGGTALGSGDRATSPGASSHAGASALRGRAGSPPRGELKKKKKKPPKPPLSLASYGAVGGAAGASKKSDARERYNRRQLELTGVARAFQRQWRMHYGAVMRAASRDHHVRELTCVCARSVPSDAPVCAPAPCRRRDLHRLQAACRLRVRARVCSVVWCGVVCLCVFVFVYAYVMCMCECV